MSLTPLDTRTANQKVLPLQAVTSCHEVFSEKEVQALADKFFSILSLNQAKTFTCYFPNSAFECEVQIGCKTNHKVEELQESCIFYGKCNESEVEQFNSWSTDFYYSPAENSYVTTTLLLKMKVPSIEGEKLKDFFYRLTSQKVNEFIKSNHLILSKTKICTKSSPTYYRQSI